MTPQHRARIFRASLALVAFAALLAALRFLNGPLREQTGGAILAALAFAQLPLCIAPDRDFGALRPGALVNVSALAFLAAIVTLRAPASRPAATVFGILAVLSVAVLASLTPSSRSLHSVYEEEIRRAAAQQERNRLARDLHDSIKQQIFAIQTGTAAAQARFDTDPSGAREALQAIRSSAREAMTEMEALLDQLRAAPLESVGLIEALRRQCEALQFRTGARVNAELAPLPEGRQLPPGAAQSLFRVAQEGLSNVARHARATEVSVSLTTAGGECRLSIQDNGAGFSPGETAEGMGLSNMRSRVQEQGGTLRVSSKTREGTVLVASIPLTKPSDPVLLRKGQILGAAALLLGALSFLMPNAFTAGMMRGFAIGLFASAVTQFVAWRRK